MALILHYYKMEKKMQTVIKKNRIKDPEIIFKNFLELISDMIIEIEEKFSANYEELIAFLKNNEPDLMNHIETNYQKIDSDIYRKYRENELSTNELDRWERSLKDWYISIKAGIKKFIEFKSTIIN